MLSAAERERAPARRGGRVGGVRGGQGQGEPGAVSAVSNHRCQDRGRVRGAGGDGAGIGGGTEPGGDGASGLGFITARVKPESH